MQPGEGGELPVKALAGRVAAALGACPRLVLTAPTGSGKSTCLPQILLDSGVVDGRVIVLQPRRLAARLLALRVAAERGCRAGGEVGYQVRFEDVSSAATRILFLTEGILTRRMVRDPLLDGVGAVVLDEFHERHLHSDVALGRVLGLQESLRPDLKLVVMSATLDVEPLAAFMSPCEVIVAAGRAHPVDIGYLARPAGDAPWDVAGRELGRRAREGWTGGALVFMPGAWEIGRTLRALEAEGLGKRFELLPLHGELPLAKQQAAVAPGGGNRIVVATNVAETSLTIAGVNLVVDSGLARVARYDPHRGIDTLLVEKISRASADQRAGRAGRTGPGACLRLWTEAEHGQRPAFEAPEVSRLDLAETVLALGAAGVGGAGRFRWFERPPERSLARAEALLRDLGALDPATGEITGVGRQMEAFPVHPRHARMLLAGAAHGCLRTAALVAALTAGRPILIRRAGAEAEARRWETVGEEENSDLLALVRAWEHARSTGYSVDACGRIGVHAGAAREVGAAFEQFLAIARRQGLADDAGEPTAGALEMCLLAGFSDHLAVRRDEGTLRCDVVHGRRGTLDRDSVVRRSRMLVAAEIREIESGGGDIDVRLGLATAVSEASLREIFPGDLSERLDVSADAVQRRVVARPVRLFRDLVIWRGPECAAPPEEAARLLAADAIAGRCSPKEWDEAVEQWIGRVNFLAAQMPELGIATIGDAERRAMMEQICYGASSHRDVKDRPVWPVVRGWLNGAQVEALERLAPDRVELPSGRRGRMRYGASGDPVLSARVQDLYGLAKAPPICGGRVVPVVEILGPNHRPVQTTKDLEGFWRDTYPRVRQELSRRYPKHEWR